MNERKPNSKRLLTLLLKLAVLVALFCQVPLAMAEDSCGFELIDGEITEHKYKGHHGYIRVSVPAEAPPEQGYPLVLYYHGWSTGLKPNLRIMQAVTGGKDYLLVGMNFRTKRFYEQLDRRNLRLELGHFDKIIDDISACRPVNRRAVFLAGYSQGGYAASMIVEQRAEQVAGMILLGSARRHAKMYMDEAEAVEGLPIFIGAGENDVPHYHYAKTSARLYALMGATVSMETWPDTNHGQGWGWYVKDPARGAGLKAWMDSVVAGRLQAP
jgi:poly(3-hydroxybutyrate) depolymerase